MAPELRKRKRRPSYVETNSDELESFEEFTQLLKNLTGQSSVTPDEDVKLLESRKSHSGVKYQKGKQRQEDTDYFPSKRRRKEEPLKLNIPLPGTKSSRPPSVEPYPGSAHPAAKVIEEEQCSVPPISSEDDEYARRCFNTSTTPGSNSDAVDEANDTNNGGSDATKEVVENSSPLDTRTNVNRVKRPIVVYSFEDLITPSLHVNNPGIGADIAELMNCDEGTMCEVSADTMSLNEGHIQTKEKPLNHEKPGVGADIVELMSCDEGTMCEANADTISLQKRKKRDVTLVERFTEEEIKLHIKSLTKPSSQVTFVPQRANRKKCRIKKKKEPCQLCGDIRLSFPPPPIYCSTCNSRIKDEATYYTPKEELSDAQLYKLCSPCHTIAKANFTILGTTFTISKANMVKNNNTNNQVTEEWVQCETCDKWQHQICGLYNKLKDEDKTAHYLCPKCLLEERQSINNMQVNDNTDLGAKDLPETILSYSIEQRLFRRLKEERSETAKATGKSIDDISVPEGLTVRVVFSADQTSTVNKQLANLLHKENYPSEFPNRSKVILLFQKVDGVDICIFALFVQEFGSECSQPNQRSTYIYYLDSVKYFRPERVTFKGEALRTFVYHEILIGYLEHCKLRGFMTSYIWACPPLEGVDYIMYSHPKTQQTPNSKKLRQWYMSMLEKAVDQKIVTNITNLYDRFFVSRDVSTCDMTAARLPYFEGYFWSNKAEILFQEIEKKGNKEFQKKVKSLSRRRLKGVSYKSTSVLDDNDVMNILLMQELEKKVYSYKEDLMVVELNYSCTRCSKAILSGWRWFCEKCKNLQLCESCYDAEPEELPGEHKRTRNDKQKHQLSKVQVNGIQSTTEDNDIIQENDMFVSRQAFLAFSQNHNYNFDTLRRAKYSSMMILHHLHTSSKIRLSENSSSLTCTSCKKDVSTTIYFPCLLCPDYRACIECYTNNKTLRGLHIFPTLPSANGAQPRTVMVLEILNAMTHVLLCPSTDTELCSYPKCKEVKALFSHSAQCKIRDKGVCKTCSKVSQTIRIHVHHCQNLNCRLPHCRNKKEVRNN